MSWTDIFPILEEHHIEQYLEKGSIEERNDLKKYFTIEKTLGKKTSRHIVCVSLSPLSPHSPQNCNLFSGVDASALLHKRQSGQLHPWEEYKDLLIKTAQTLEASKWDVTLRIYLAKELDFLASDLVEYGCEIKLMPFSSTRANPSAMWSFLGLGERGRLVTVSSISKIGLIESGIARTDAIANSGFGFWRIPAWGDLDSTENLAYRPILATQFGSTKAIPTQRLMEALIWHTNRGLINTKITLPGSKKQAHIKGIQWSDWGFDEWFLLTALFPRVARRGLITFLRSSASSQLLPIDIEYVTWLNRKSEIVHFEEEKQPAPIHSSKSFKQKRASNKQVLLTGMWQVKTHTDRILIEELYHYALSQDISVEIRPILHVLNPDILSDLPSKLVQNSILWENFNFTTRVQKNLVKAASEGSSADWIWEADSDERVDFKITGGLRKVIERADDSRVDYVPGLWIDRISQSNLLPDITITDGIDLAKCFPRAVYAVKYLSGACSTKIALHRSDCPTCDGNHNVEDPTKTSANWNIPIWHFKWHSECFKNQTSKFESHKNEGWALEFMTTANSIEQSFGRDKISWDLLPQEAWPRLHPTQKRGAYPIYKDTGLR